MALRYELNYHWNITEKKEFSDELLLLVQKKEWLTQSQKVHQHGSVIVKERYFVKYYAAPLQIKEFLLAYNKTCSTTILNAPAGDLSDESVRYHLALCTDVKFWVILQGELKEENLADTVWNDDLQAVLVTQPYFDNSLASVLRDLHALGENIEVSQVLTLIEVLLVALQTIHSATFLGNIKMENVFVTISDVAGPCCTFTDPFHPNVNSHIHQNEGRDEFLTRHKFHGRQLDLWCLGKIILNLVATVTECEQSTLIKQFLRERLFEARSQVCSLPQLLEIVRRPAAIFTKCLCQSYILHPCLIQLGVQSCERCVAEKMMAFSSFIQKQNLPFTDLNRQFPVGDEVQCLCHCCESELLTKVLDDTGESAFICDGSDCEYQWYICQICQIKILKKGGHRQQSSPDTGVFQDDKSIYCACCVKCALNQDQKRARTSLIETHFYQEIEQRFTRQSKEKTQRFLSV